MTYTLTSGTSVVRDADKTTIPDDPRNADWQIYQEWLAASNVPHPAPAALIPVLTVSIRQFFQASANLGLITEVEALAFIQARTLPSSLAAALFTLPAGSQFAAKMSICGAGSYVRTDPFVISLGDAMGLTSEQIDALFTLADTL